MKALLSLACVFIGAYLQAQHFDVLYTTESVKASIGETLQSSLRIKNNDSKTLTLVLRKLPSSLGSTQRSFLCQNGNCHEELVIKVEPGQTTSDLSISFYTGLSAGLNTSRYVVFNKNTPSDAVEFDVNFVVQEPEERKSIYTSRFITLHDVYPNPVIESAEIDYTIHEPKPKYTVIIRNLLGNIVNEYPLDEAENKIKMRTEDLNAGIYFFSLYIDNESVMTHKMMVKK